MTRKYVYKTGILGQFKWESLKKRRNDNRLILYEGLKGKARVPTDGLIPKNRCCKNQHLLPFRYPLLVKTFIEYFLRDWNDRPDSLLSSAKLSDDCGSKFTSLVRARD